MLPLGEVLNSLIKSFGFEKQLRIAKALELWEEVAGPEVASKTRALRFRNGVLVVAVPSPAWAQQLSLLRHKLCDRLNETCHAPLVHDIHFRVAEIPILDSAPPKQSSQESKLKRVAGDCCCEELTQEIMDEELRMAFQRAFRAAHGGSQTQKGE